MSFWNRKKQASSRAANWGDKGRVKKAKKSFKRSPPEAMEVNVLALEAPDLGLLAQEPGELVGVGSGTIHKWPKDHEEGGVQGKTPTSAWVSAAMVGLSSGGRHAIPVAGKATARAVLALRGPRGHIDSRRAAR